jgi:NAD-dependent SIR2 family protein deacetylase
VPSARRSPGARRTGSFATASCLICRRRFPGTAIEPDVFSSRVPLCPFCTPELEAAVAILAREREERPKKKRKVGREEWEGSDESDEEDSGEMRSEWDGKALIKPDIVFFGCVSAVFFPRVRIVAVLSRHSMRCAVVRQPLMR